MSDDQPIEQHKCPVCGEYRRGYKGSHGIIAHCFFDHSMSGDEIRLALLNEKPSITIMGLAPLGSDWWDEFVLEEKR